MTIGSGKPPVEGALLMLDDGTTGTANQNAKRGLGLPRVVLDAYDELKIGGVEYPDKAAHTGLIVYNLADPDKKCDTNHPTTGLHIWNGERWEGINAEKKFVPNREAPGPDVVYAPNAYIATAGSTIAIPVEKAFAIWDWWGGGEHPDGQLLLETSADFVGNMSIAVLWEEAEGGAVTGNPIIQSISFDPSSIVANKALDKTATMYVKVKADAIGNAVVTLSDNKQVRWSWHIWVPKDDPRINTYTYDTGKQINTWMDRNLGASRSGVSNGVLQTDDLDYTIGFHYQWGRKDPFPGYRTLSGTTMTTSALVTEVQADNSATMNLTTAISSPLTFIEGGDYPNNDWYSINAEQWNSRWGDSKDECGVRYAYKSEMDPCPAGWKMPSFNGYSSLDSPWTKKNEDYSSNPTNYTNIAWDRGWYFDSSKNYELSWYPAAASRGKYSGLHNVGTSGCYWSASRESLSYAYYLYLSSMGVHPGNSHSLTDGNSVRCVKE